MKIIDITTGTYEWHEWRRKGIGASDIPAIMGVCPYKTELDIYNDKLGLSIERRSTAMQRGVEYESEARHIFCKSQPGNPRYEPLLIEHDDIPFYRASLDGYNSFNRTILEIKVPGRKTMNQAAIGFIPINYQYQIQWQLFVSASPKAYYFCYDPDTLEAYTIEVYPDDEVIEKILVKVEHFMANLLAGVAPTPKSKSYVLQDVESIELIKDLIKLKAEEKRIKEEYSSKLKRLLDREGQDCSISYKDYLLSKSERSTIDYKRAAISAGVNLEQYRKEAQITWTIKLKGQLIEDDGNS